LADSSSVVVAVWGIRYQPFIERWWNSVRTLNRKPGEIVLVSNLEDESKLFDSIPGWVDVPVIKVQIDSDKYNELWAAGVHATTKEWIVKLCVDDQFCPEALDFLESVEGDLVIDRCKFLQGGEWVATWDLRDIENRNFAPASFSPFRRTLIEFYKQIPNPCVWDDYVFYLLLAKANVRIYQTDNYRMIHDLGYNHETISGISRNQEKAAQAQEEFSQIRKELEI
jgi:hypothetical protein